MFSFFSAKKREKKLTKNNNKKTLFGQLPLGTLARARRLGNRHADLPRQGPLDAQARPSRRRGPNGDSAPRRTEEENRRRIASFLFFLRLLRLRVPALPAAGQRRHLPALRVPGALRRRPRPRPARAPDAEERQGGVGRVRRDLRRPGEPLLPRRRLRVLRRQDGQGGARAGRRLGDREGREGGRGGAEDQRAELSALQGEEMIFFFNLSFFSLTFSSDSHSSPRTKNKPIKQACDIKEPAHNIVWTVPEGGGGPNYTEL